ncbi:MAG: hypothetical protein JW840_02550 [Candidatus Thermoplasmatota archaeon]|nr:hypothetical protein [Candidatus Thermoplasmatota archaeon]
MAHVHRFKHMAERVIAEILGASQVQLRAIQSKRTGRNELSSNERRNVCLRQTHLALWINGTKLAFQHPFSRAGRAEKMKRERLVFPYLKRGSSRIVLRHVKDLLHTDDGIKTRLRWFNVKDNSVRKPEAGNIALRQLMNAIKPIVQTHKITFSRKRKISRP